MAGLTILLSLIVMLFIIGLLIMIFSIMGSSLRDSTYTSTTVTVLNETKTFPSNNAVQTLSASTKRNVVCGTPSAIRNQTAIGQLLTVGNFTLSGCTITNATALSSEIGNGTVFVTYSYTWDADNDATDVMNDTTVGIASVTDWFDIFIVIGAMVVLILLIVIIITAIKGSGMIAGGETSNTNSVGSA